MQSAAPATDGCRTAPESVQADHGTGASAAGAASPSRFCTPRRVWGVGVSLGRAGGRLFVAVSVCAACVLSVVAPAFAAAPEAPETTAPTSVTASSATFHGVLNPHSEALAGYDFTFGANPSCEGGPTEAVGEALVKELPVEATVSGLEPAREYTFCLLATNVVSGVPGSSAGAPVPFKTLALAPTVDAESATAVGSTAATLEGQVNPNNQATSFSFEYGTAEDFKGATKVNGAGPLPAEYGDRTASVPALSGLKAGTRYFYRLIAENAQSKVEGVPVVGLPESFVTPPAPVTDEPSGVGAESATLHGHLTLSESETQLSFELSLGEGCTGGSNLAATPPSAKGAGESAAEAPASGLQPNALYTVCFGSASESGSQLGAPVQFKTLPAPPKIESEAATAVTETAAGLEGQVNPNNQKTTFVWEFSAEGEVGGALTGTIESIPGAAPLTGYGAQAANVTTKGLNPRTAYYYRVTATNAAAEKSEAEVKSFTTLDKPLVSVEPAAALTRTQATLSGTVNPGGEPTTYHWVYVEAGKYNPGAEECAEAPCAYAAGLTTPVTGVGSDYSAHPAGLQITELKPGTTYDYALVATNSLGTRVGPNQELTTSSATPPAAITGAASAVSQLSATIAGSVDTRGLPTAIRFELLPAGVAVGNGSLIPAAAGEQSGTTVQVSAFFNEDLQPGATYSYRLLASNADGVAEGQLLSFTTTAVPVPPAFVLAASPPFIAFPSIAELEAKEAREHPAPKPLTNKQRLEKALKACHKDKKKSRRQACERQARSKYGAKKGKK